MRICFQIILFILSTATFLVSCSSGEHGPSKQDTDQPTDIDKLNEQIAQNPDDATVYLNRGQYYYDAQVYSEAVSDFIRCVELDSSQVPC